MRKTFPSTLFAKSLIASSVLALAVISASSNAIVRDDEVRSDNKAELSNRIIVKYKNTSRARGVKIDSKSFIDRIAREGRFKMQHERMLATGNQLVEMQERMSEYEMDAMLNKLRKDPNVEEAYRDVTVYATLTPDDTRYSEQWHYFEEIGGANLPAAWDLSTGSGVVVAVIDSGIQPHADLVANLLPGYDFVSDAESARDGDGRDPDASDEGNWFVVGECEGDPTGSRDSNWHGTHVAGTIAAQTNNATGVAGVAFGAKVVPVRALGKCGGSLADIGDSIIWAAGGSVPGAPVNPNPAKVINMSLGGASECNSNTQEAIDIARDLGATVVVSAGNAGQDASTQIPANCDGVVSVAAINRAGSRAFYSNFGDVVDLAAPGGNREDGVLSTINAGATTPEEDSLAGYLGTSMAAPHVAGVAAMMIEANPALTPDDVERILKQSARRFVASCDGCGDGLLDAEAAVTAALDAVPDGVELVESDLSGRTRTWQHFQLEVPAGVSGLEATLSGGTGDADLYVRRGAQPTRRNRDCRSQNSNNEEQCFVNAPAAGTWYVSVYAYRTYSGVELRASAE